MSNSIPTPHIEAKKGDFAKTVIMPGDPLRAKYIAETFLEDVVQVNGVRGMLGYTGTYNGKRVSVMGSGMGMPSIGIYSYELFSFYDVSSIIRVGSAGAMREDIKIRDIVIAQGASTNSNYAIQYGLPGSLAGLADFGLLSAANEVATKANMNVHVGNILSSDIFYDVNPETYKKWAKMNVLCAEMEAYALYANAAYLGKKALCILTISDSIVTGEKTTATERQTTFNDMLKVALEIAEA